MIELVTGGFNDWLNTIAPRKYGYYDYVLTGILPLSPNLISAFQGKVKTIEDFLNS